MKKDKEKGKHNLNLAEVMRSKKKREIEILPTLLPITLN
jgi:hypothetical protein